MSLEVRQETFDSLQDEWKALAEGPSRGSVFVTPAWLRAWWESCRSSEELLLLAFRQGGELRGVAPLMRSGETVRFIAYSDLCDYHDFLFSDGLEGEFYPALLETLAASEGRNLVLEGLAEDSPTVQCLPDLARERGLAVRQTLEEVSPGLSVPASWEEYLSSLTKKDRHELRRKLRRLSNAGEFTCRDVVEGCNLSDNLTAFVELLKRSREDKAQFLNESRERFFRTMAEAMAREGYLKLFFLELDGVRVAASLCFDYKSSYYLYNSGYDTQFASLSVGLLLKVLCLKDAIEQRKGRFDFLRGSEPYKYDLGAQDTRLYKLEICR